MQVGCVRRPAVMGSKAWQQGVCVCSTLSGFMQIGALGLGVDGAWMRC